MADIVCDLIDESFEQHVLNHLHRIEHMIMTTQADIDALTATVATLTTALSSADTAFQAAFALIEAELANLHGAGIDITALTTGVNALKAAQAQLTTDAATDITTATPPVVPAPVATPVATAPVDVVPAVQADPAAPAPTA